MSSDTRDAHGLDGTVPDSAGQTLPGVPGVKLEPGAVVGDYVIEELRSTGGFAQVFRARRTADGAAVALKILHTHLAASPELLVRFALEARTLRRIRHPNIVEILDVGEVIVGHPFIAMEWIDAPTLDEDLRRRGPFALPEVIALMADLCGALGAAHAAEVVHRDVKASNVMAIPKGEWFTVKLLDFGIAKLLDPRDPAHKGLTATGTRLGTPHNMAPEQVLGQLVDRRADIYALGVLMYQLLAGKPPYHGATSVEIEEMHLAAPIPRVSDVAPVSPAVDAVIARCLAKSRTDRFDSVEDLLAELRGTLTGATRDRPSKRLPAGREAAVAVFAKVEIAAADDELDDAILDDVERVDALIAATCAAAGFEVVDEGTGARLAVKSERAAPVVPTTLRKDAVTLALAIADAVAARAGAHPKVAVALAVHAGHVIRIVSAAEALVVGGDVIGAKPWKETRRAGAVLASPEVLAGIEGEFALGMPEGATLASAVSRRAD
jgi:serine/threonine-protein kinase